LLNPRYEAESNAPSLLQTTVDPQFGFSSKGGQAFIDGLTKFRSVLDAMKRILADGRGAAFHVVPNKGIIPPWAEITVKINSYNNMVGIYEDTLKCQVGKYHRQLPIRLGVIGIPVKFTGPQLVSKHDFNPNNPLLNFDMVNFGARVINPKLGATDGARMKLKNGHHPAPVLVKKGSFNMLNVDTTPQQPQHPIKRVNIENHSPREIKLSWVVYNRMTDIREKKLDAQNEDDTRLEDIIRPENLIKSNEVGVIDISPQVMTIPPFKTAVLQCNFRNCGIGNYDAVVLADVAYIEGKDKVKYGPRRITKNGEMPKEDRVLTPGVDTIQVKDLDVIAKLRIKAKCIEPRLGLDIGTKIRIKKALRLTADTAEYTSLSTVQFLVNQSDAVCDFTLKTVPDNLFSIKPSKLYLKDANVGLYELKQKQQMMITINYIGSTTFTDLSSKRRVSFTPLDERPRSFYASERASSVKSPNVVTEVNEASGLLTASSHSRKNSQASERGVTPPAVGRRASTSKRRLSISTTPDKKSPAYSNLIHTPSVAKPIESTLADTIPSLSLETGSIVISYTNGMTQEIPIVLEGVYE
jgi:hypothetical protein